MQKQVWEILVPVYNNSGNKFSLEIHKEWDARVYNITNGLTILPAAKGYWKNDSGDVLEEQMIPVRIVCTLDQMNKIADMTAMFYDQDAVLFYSISNEVFMRKRDA